MILKKVLDNVGYRAVKVLGIKQYLRMLGEFVRSIPVILRQRTLVALDKRMSAYVLSVHVNQRDFQIDLPYIDTQIQEDSFAYGSVREIFIRNCYFRFHHIDLSKIKTVIDLGGNRGFFSTLCASFAAKIITVEPGAQYNEVITRNLKNANPAIQPVIINKFVGGQGLIQHDTDAQISFDRIIQEHHIDYIDFLKIDIEGSEFSLFQDGLPFPKIRYLSMEVHRDCGDPRDLLNILHRHNFHTTCCDANFNITEASNQIDYIYARNEALELAR